MNRKFIQNQCLIFYGKSYPRIYSVVDSVCMAHNFKKLESRDKKGYLYKHYEKRTDSSLLIIQLTPENETDKNIELTIMDFLTTRQSELSKKVEIEILNSLK